MAVRLNSAARSMTEWSVLGTVGEALHVVETAAMPDAAARPTTEWSSISLRVEKPPCLILVK